MTNYIIRPVFNRAEMLALSFEYERIARQYYNTDFVTVFSKEYGTTQEVDDVISTYPFDYEIFQRPSRPYPIRQSIGIVESILKYTEKSDKYCLLMEDDTCMHKHFFQYIDTITKTEPEALIYNAVAREDLDSKKINTIVRCDKYYGWVNLHNKKKLDIVAPYLDKYLYNFMECISSLDDQYSDIIFPRGLYTHNSYEQDGLFSRIGIIEGEKGQVPYVMPCASRMLNIGVVGVHTPGIINGNTFKERMDTIKKWMEDFKDKDSKAAKTFAEKMWFDNDLNSWNGNLYYE